MLTSIAAIFTLTFGGWSFAVFLVTAFASLFNSLLGVHDGGRMGIAHAIRLLRGQKMVGIEKMREHPLYRATLIGFSIIPLIIFLDFPKPVFLIIASSVISAVSMPLLGGLVLWSLLKQVPEEHRPSKFYIANLALGVIVYLFFMFQALTQLKL